MRQDTHRRAPPSPGLLYRVEMRPSRGAIDERVGDSALVYMSGGAVLRFSSSGHAYNQTEESRSQITARARDMVHGGGGHLSPGKKPPLCSVA